MVEKVCSSKKNSPVSSNVFPLNECKSRKTFIINTNSYVTTSKTCLHFSVVRITSTTETVHKPPNNNKQGFRKRGWFRYTI